MRNIENIENILFDENIHDYVDTYSDGIHITEIYEKYVYPTTKITKYYQYDKFTVGKLYEYKSYNGYKMISEILEILYVTEDDGSANIIIKQIILFTTDTEHKNYTGTKKWFVNDSHMWAGLKLLED
jgi:hypothetical protein